jgi:hypothetical protein
MAHIPHGRLPKVPAAQAPRALHSTQPGLALEYNHDLNVSEEFLASYPLIRDLLKDRRLLEEFHSFDRTAKSSKRAFQTLGFLSLVLGLIPLLISAARMVAGEATFPTIADLSVAADFCGAVAIALVLFIRFRRYRAKWCQSVFCRERLRQWHFQLFLDGQLINLSRSRPAEFGMELDRRWSRLRQNLRDGYGMMTQFVNFASQGDDFFHQQTEYPDAALAKEAFDALMTLRFDHQLRFSRRKIEPDGQEAGLTLAERTTLSETVATVTFAGAVLTSAIAFVLTLDQLIPGLRRSPTDLTATGRVLGGVALFLAVLSAASRAYRAGFTLPDESESYDEYCDRVRELKAAFRSVGTDGERLRLLKQLEEESAVELRRFLRMKMRATFLF